MPRPKLTLFLFATCLIFVSASPINSQDLQKEFLEDARANWLDVRQKSFADFSYEIKKEEFEFDKTGKETRKIVTKSKWFSQGDFIYYESTPLVDTNSKVEIPFGRRHIKISNGKEAVMAQKDSKENSSWNLVAREKLKEKFQFDSKTLKPGWYQYHPRTVANSLAFSLADDPRLALGRTSPLEFYIQFLEKTKPKIFDEFSISNDPVLGRVVTASFSLSPKLRIGPKGETNGRFRFLADRNWLPLSMKTVTKYPKTEEQPARETTQTFSAEYNRESIANSNANKRPPIPASVEFVRSNSRDRGSLKIRQTFRPLSMKEIVEINTFRSFKKFE